MKNVIGTIIGAIIGGILLAIIMAIIGPILPSSGDPGGRNVKIVIEKSACNCLETTCSMCLRKMRAGNDPVNPGPSVPSPHGQPVQTHSESDYMIQQRAKQNSDEWYDEFLEDRKANW